MFILGLPIVSSAQEEWSLKDCLDYATENNIALKRQRIQSDMYKNDLWASKANLLPSLNFRTTGNKNFGRSVDPGTNDITFNQTISNGLSLGSSVTIFNGFTLVNRMSAAKFLYKMGIELQEQQLDLMSLDIINAYYELIMARGLVETAGRQLEVSEEQLHRIDVMVRTGSENRTTLLEMQSQVSNDRLLYTQAINNEILGLDKLRRLLQLDPETAFDIIPRSAPVQVAEKSLINVDSVYSVASDIMPGINALVYKQSAREKEYKASIGEATPELSFSAGWGTGYFDANMVGVETIAYSEQLKNNINQSLQATLSIPIFNGWYYGRNIKRARLNLEDSRLELEEGRNNLYQEVNSACLELSAIHDEYLAALDSREFSDLAFIAVEKKFQIGMANATEYSEARRQKFSAEVELLSMELQYELKQITIQFYLTGEWMN